MEIKTIQDKDEWNGWIFGHSSVNHFTQSWFWGDILIAEGKKVERLAVVEGGEVVAQAQVVYTRLIFGWHYAFCPKGPAVVSSSKHHVSSIYKALIQYLKNKKCIFFRIEPAELNTKYLIQNTKSIDVNPSATLLLDLNKSASELLAAMHAKTRYNINLAKKKNITVVQEKNLEVFWKLMNKTGSRDNFGLHHKNHYAAVLASHDVFQLVAYQEKTPVACAVFVGFGNTFTYLYGASDYDYRNLMAPYLLQWEGMEIGNDFGSKWYDFFGVAPRLLVQPQDSEYNYDPKHQYAGVTRFKLGFGGVAHQDPGTFDILVSKSRYAVYKILRKLRRLF